MRQGPARLTAKAGSRGYSRQGLRPWHVPEATAAEAYCQGKYEATPAKSDKADGYAKDAKPAMRSKADGPPRGGREGGTDDGR